MLAMPSKIMKFQSPISQKLARVVNRQVACSILPGHLYAEKISCYISHPNLLKIHNDTGQRYPHGSEWVTASDAHE